MNRPDPTLLSIFASEQSEHVQRLRTLLKKLRDAGAEEVHPILDEILRRAHTLKGAARAVGLGGTEQVVHRMETAISAVRGQSGVAVTVCDSISRALDHIEDILAWALGQRSEPDSVPVLHSLDALAGYDRASTVPPPPQSEAERSGEVAPVTELMRIDPAYLDAVVRTSAEVLAALGAPTTGTMQLSAHASVLDETAKTFARLREACAGFLQRPSENADAAPVVEALRYVDGRLAQLQSSCRHALIAQQQGARTLRRSVGDLHDYATRTRLSPAGAVLGGLGPMVRDVAGQERKEVRFQAEGLDVQADRVVLQALREPVLHLLRNAVSHGIEAPEERVRAGKDRSGSVLLRVETQGDRLIVTVSDDGGGLDAERLWSEARRRGAPSPADKSAPALHRLIFERGFSTSKTVSEISGRGLGLAIVKDVADRLRGSVSVESQPCGTTVSISVPVIIGAEHVLLVKEGDSTFAIPVSVIESLTRVRRDNVVIVQGRPSIPLDADAVPIVELRELLLLSTGQQQAKHFDQDDRPLPVVICRSGTRRIAVVVGHILDDMDVLIQETALPESMRGLSSGATPLEDGTVAVLLAMPQILENFLEGKVVSEGFRVRREQRKARILVVDDSVTTRSMERTILEANGFEVDLAVDGIEAIDRVRQSRPDLIISDVAMPRMDGFQLLETLKRDNDTSEIPVILITSLESPVDQERGLSLGADAYIVKRKFDQRELLETVRQIL